MINVFFHQKSYAVQPEGQYLITFVQVRNQTGVQRVRKQMIYKKTSITSTSLFTFTWYFIYALPRCCMATVEKDMRIFWYLMMLWTIAKKSISPLTYEVRIVYNSVHFKMGVSTLTLTAEFGRIWPNLAEFSIFYLFWSLNSLCN